ncbi:hypothetical protein BH11PSE11_BH11PSE11_04160 [soil metagenome]
MMRSRDVGMSSKDQYPARKAALRNQRLLMPLVRAGFTLCLFMPLYSTAQTPEPKVVPEIDPGATIYCKLPAQTRKMSSRDSYTVPGKVVRITAGKCKERGGSPVPLRPAKKPE